MKSRAGQTIQCSKTGSWEARRRKSGAISTFARSLKCTRRLVGMKGRTCAEVTFTNSGRMPSTRAWSSRTLRQVTGLVSLTK
jgi:hypothetical protein